MPLNPLPLKDKTAVILGGTGTLGQAMVQGLASAGATIILLGRNPEKLQILSQTISGTYHLVDIADESSLKSIANTLANQNQTPDILLTASGGNQPAATLQNHQTFKDLSLESYQSVIDLNLIGGAINPILAFADHMIATQKPASIITITSVSSDLPLTKVGAYSAAKAAVKSFTKYSAVELSKRSEGRVRVNAIEPGFYITDQNRDLLIDPQTSSPTERGQLILNHTPAGRFGDPQDLIGATIFLASDDSKFVNGTAIQVDGGFMASWGV